MRIIEFEVDLCTSPAQTLYQHYVEPLHIAGNALARAILLVCTDPIRFGNHVGLVAVDVAGVVWNNPEEVIATAFEFFLPSPTSNFKKLRKLDPIVKAFQDQQKIVGAFANKTLRRGQETVNKVKQLISPLPQVFTKPLLLKKYLEQHGPECIPLLESIIEKSLRVVVGESKKCSAAEAVKTLGNRLPAINLHHIFSGELNEAGKLVGFHHSRRFRERITEITKRGTHGIFEATYSVGVHRKPDCSFFPTSWSETKVLDKVIEAYKNTNNQKIGDWILERYTSEGIKLRFCFKKMKECGEIIIESVFPIID